LRRVPTRLIIAEHRREGGLCLQGFDQIFQGRGVLIAQPLLARRTVGGVRRLWPEEPLARDTNGPLLLLVGGILGRLAHRRAWQPCAWHSPSRPWPPPRRRGGSAQPTAGSFPRPAGPRPWSTPAEQATTPDSRHDATGCRLPAPAARLVSDLFRRSAAAGREGRGAGECDHRSRIRLRAVRASSKGWGDQWC